MRLSWGKVISYKAASFYFCTNDSTGFIYKGIQPNKSSEIGLASKVSLKHKGSTAICHSKDSKKMNGLRIKQYLITNTRGDAAPACYAIFLTKREMPKDDFIVWLVPGLCPGGYSMNGSTKPGIVYFAIKGKKGMEHCRFHDINERIYFEFVEDCHKFYDGRKKNHKLLSVMILWPLDGAMATTCRLKRLSAKKESSHLLNAISSKTSIPQAPQVYNKQMIG